LWEHKVRSFLTAFGITLAIAAIVALGSISEGINEMMLEQMNMIGDLVMVSEKGSTDLSAGMMAMPKVDLSLVDEISQIDGVELASPGIEMMDPSSHTYVVGLDLDHLETLSLDDVEFKEGGWAAIDELELVIGSSLSDNLNLNVGDEIVLSDDEYVISGVAKERNDFIDFSVVSSWQSIAKTYDSEEYVSSIIVTPTDVRDSERIANEIDEWYDTVEAFTSAEMLETADEVLGQFRLITFAVGFIASIVAAIGIINTMMMAVMERKKDFGIMKALGAEQKTMMSLVLQDAAIIAILGGSVGLFLGYLGTEAVNQAMPFPFATVTPGLAIFSLLYGIFMAAIATIYPAYQAIKVDPVEAMREG